jgi:hypothetical protein
MISSARCFTFCLVASRYSASVLIRTFADRRTDPDQKMVGIHNESQMRLAHTWKQMFILINCNDKRNRCTVFTLVTPATICSQAITSAMKNHVLECKMIHHCTGKLRLWIQVVRITRSVTLHVVIVISGLVVQLEDIHTYKYCPDCVAWEDVVPWKDHGPNEPDAWLPEACW